MTKFEESLEKIKELLPELHYGTTCALEECHRLGKQIVVTSVYRSQAQQNALWRKGRDVNGRIIDRSKIVTYTLYSDHTRRMAIDILPLGYAKMTQKAMQDALSEVAGIFLAFGIYRPPETLSWGDYGHFKCDKATRRPLVPSPIPCGLYGESLYKWIDRRVQRMTGNARLRAIERLERNIADSTRELPL
jgi:hypothetical protein